MAHGVRVGAVVLSEIVGNAISLADLERMVSQRREAAFAACADLVDTVKARMPIWKHQLLRGRDR